MISLAHGSCDQIRSLKKELENACKIDERKLASQIKATGFKCRKCAQCCRSEFGDNTVIVSPGEIRKICTRYELLRNDFIIPTPSDDRDRDGNIHTFEWVLKKNDDCIFLKKELCGIYECRPFICKTYPFYLRDGELELCECIGLGGNISDMESLELAGILKERYIQEINESIGLLEKFEGLNPGGSGSICVHDSEGEHWL